MSFVGTFFGPMYWGFVISTALVGTTFVQGYVYYDRSRDPLSIRVVVALMIILDLSSTVVIATTVSHYFIVDFGNYATFDSVPPEWVLETTLTAVVTCIAQLFFATRIHIIMKECAVFGPFERMIPGIITFTAVLSLMAGIGKTVIIWTESASPQQLGEESMIITTSLEEGLAFVADLFTTCTLCCILVSAQDGLRRASSPIRRLFFFILNRGILVTALQIGALIAFVIKPGYMYWMPFHLSKSKLYTNTLLAMLNSRMQTEELAPQTRYFCRSLPHQDVSSGETASQERSEIPDRDQIRTWENAGVHWDALSVSAAPEKQC